MIGVLSIPFSRMELLLHNHVPLVYRVCLASHHQSPSPISKQSILIREDILRDWKCLEKRHQGP